MVTLLRFFNLEQLCPYLFKLLHLTIFEEYRQVHFIECPRIWTGIQISTLKVQPVGSVDKLKLEIWNRQKPRVDPKISSLENWKDGMPSSKTGKLRSSRFGEKDQEFCFDCLLSRGNFRHGDEILIWWLKVLVFRAGEIQLKIKIGSLQHVNDLFHSGSIDKNKRRHKDWALRPPNIQRPGSRRGDSKGKGRWLRGEKLKEYDILETKWEKCSEERRRTNAEDWGLNSVSEGSQWPDEQFQWTYRGWNPIWSTFKRSSKNVQIASMAALWRVFV